MIKPVATATVKATQERYFIYNIASYTTENTVYALWVNRTGHVVSCSCKDWKFRKAERPNGCKHMQDLQAQIDACKAAKEARKAVAEAEKIVAEQARAELAKQAALVAEITATFEAERAEMVAEFEQKEAALEREVKAVIKVEKKRRAEACSVWNSPYVSTSNLKPALALRTKTVEVKRAPQFTNAQLAQLASPANRGFSLLKPAC